MIMDRSDVFISYRRTDRDFTRQLVTALEGQGREVWIDWEDIPPGSLDFTDDIRRGVEAADAFVAVLSPAYLESEYCLGELALAIEHGKRIVPLVLERFDDAGLAVPASIAHINWVYFTPFLGAENAFAEAFPKLMAALDVDQEHARAHTRLYLRAREWEARERAAGYLLSGAEVDEAETWLMRGGGKLPLPTDLHGDYIVASREAEAARAERERQLEQQSRNRLRLLIAMLVIGVALVLLSFALFGSLMHDQVSTLAEDNLLNLTQFAANGINGDELTALVSRAVPDERGLTGDPYYWLERQWFDELRELDDAIWPYTYVPTGEANEIMFIADSFAAQYPGRSAAFMERLTVAWDSPLLAGFEQVTLASDTYTDAWGTWISAYAPIRDAGNNVVGALGIDMQVDEYLALPNQISQVLGTIALALAVVAVIGTVGFIIYRQRQRRTLQDDLTALKQELA